MRSCDTCPGGDACAGNRLTPVLVRVFDLYAGGTTDKFEILFALDDDDEALLETHAANAERACWTKAALNAITEVLVRYERAAVDRGDWPAVIENTLSTARHAFARFPWHLPDLVEQAPDLYANLMDRVGGDGLSGAMSKRTFAKVCKAIVYGHLT
ncbi:MAG: hypothetical protein QF893_17855 [Alphaproteobacteria bacterium]|jgi:hypothetical protein|nr:hypothetical protein [Alphaproteobacteria bacterium]